MFMVCSESQSPVRSQPYEHELADRNKVTIARIHHNRDIFIQVFQPNSKYISETPFPSSFVFFKVVVRGLVYKNFDMVCIAASIALTEDSEIACYSSSKFRSSIYLSLKSQKDTKSIFVT